MCQSHFRDGRYAPSDPDVEELMEDIAGLEEEIGELEFALREGAQGKRHDSGLAVQPCRGKRILPFALRGVGGENAHYEIFLPNGGYGLVRVGLHPLPYGGYLAGSGRGSDDDNYFNGHGTPVTGIPEDGWLNIGDAFNPYIEIDKDNDCWILRGGGSGWGAFKPGDGSFDTLGHGIMEWGFAWPEQSYRDLGDSEDYEPISRDEPGGVRFKAVRGYGWGGITISGVAYEALYISKKYVYVNRFGVIVKTENCPSSERDQVLLPLS